MSTNSLTVFFSESPFTDVIICFIRVDNSGLDFLLIFFKPLISLPIAISFPCVIRLNDISILEVGKVYKKLFNFAFLTSSCKGLSSNVVRSTVCSSPSYLKVYSLPYPKIRAAINIAFLSPINKSS